MKNLTLKPTVASLLLGMAVVAYLPSAQAICDRTKPYINSGADDWGTSTYLLGNINLASDDIQPVGTPLGTSIFNHYQGIKLTDPERILYTCDYADKDQLAEVFSTNGDSYIGGGESVGNGYFQTYFPNVGIRLTHMNSGVVFSRIWQKVPLTNYEEGVDAQGKRIVIIRAKHFSPIKAELIKTAKNYGKSDFKWDGCTQLKPGVAGSYSRCNQPNGYVVFHGPGMVVEDIGKDHKTDFAIWGSGRTMAIGMGTAPASNLTYINETCAVRARTSEVNFPLLSIDDLKKGKSVTKTFQVTMSCSKEVKSGVGTGQVAISIQPSLGSYAKAQELKLVNSNNGVSHLVPANYGAPGVASGVGVRILENGRPINMAGLDCAALSICQGELSGWLPVTANTSVIGQVGNVVWRQKEYGARLERLPIMVNPVVVYWPLGPGKFSAVATVVVKVQ